MKKITLTMIAIFTIALANAQTPTFAWAKTSDNVNDIAQGRSIATDADGNVVVVGNFQSTTVTFGTTTLTNSPGGNDIYLVKYDSVGNILWAKGVAAGNNWQLGVSVTVDKDNNILIGGYFVDSLSFGGITLSSFGSAAEAGFVAKYDPSGNVLWAKVLQNCIIRSIAVDLGNNAVVTGNYGFDFIFGTDTVPATGEGASQYDNIFICKLDATGNSLWATHAIGTVTSVTTDFNNNVLIGGYFYESAITFDSITLNNANTLGLTTDLFLVKYNASGGVIWAKRAGGLDNEEIDAVAVDKEGNIAVSGTFSGPTLSFASTILTNTTTALSDVFVAKYDAEGNPLWATSMGGELYDYSAGVAIDTSGNILVGAYYSGPICNVGTAVLFNVRAYYYPDPMYDYWAQLVIAKYNAAGELVWVKSAGGDYDDYATDIATDGSNNIVITGYSASKHCLFDTYSLSCSLIGSTYNMFIAKLGTGGTTGITENDYSNAIINVYPNPFSTTATFKINELKNENTRLSIYDVAGREVMQVAITNEQTIIERNNLAAGLYFYKVSTKTQLIGSGKLIIQ